MMWLTNPMKIGLGAIVVTLALAAPAAHALPVNKCAAAKTKCVTGKVKGLLACHIKAEKTGAALDPGCTAKVVSKFTACVTRAENKPPCLVSGDVAALEAAVDAYVLDVVQQLDPGYPAPVENRCSACKKKAVAVKTAAKLGCLAKAYGKAPGTIDPTCLAKAETKFAAAFGKCEANTPCLTSGDEAALEATVDAFFFATLNTISPGLPCGNGIVDAGEDCDPATVATSCQNASDTGADFTCDPISCQCACPSQLTFTRDATDPLSLLDLGWLGLAHRSPLVGGSDFTVGLSACSGPSRPCGTCSVAGPIANPNAGNGELDNRRCTNDTAIKCISDAPCAGGGGTCEYFAEPYQGLGYGGLTLCLISRFDGPITGTADVESGAVALDADVLMSVYLPMLTDQPCPTCSDGGGANDGIAGGTCVGGAHPGQACDANGEVPGRPDFGRTSLDCPPLPGALYHTLALELPQISDTVTKTVSASSPNCSGETGAKCLCDTCNDAAAAVCDENADCADPAGPIGAICGGRRCLGGTNAGAACNGARQCVGGPNDYAACSVASQCPSGSCNVFCGQTCVGGANHGSVCTVDSECPGGGDCPFLSCGRPGELTEPSSCLDDPGTPGVLDCVDTLPVDGEGECVMGPLSNQCSLASGHAQRSCLGPADCGGAPGSCTSFNRPCFLTGSAAGFGNVGTQTLIAAGAPDAPVGDVSSPTLGAVACVGPTDSIWVNVIGLPGPMRLTTKGTLVARP